MDPSTQQPISNDAQASIDSQTTQPANTQPLPSTQPQEYSEPVAIPLPPAPATAVGQPAQNAQPLLGEESVQPIQNAQALRTNDVVDTTKSITEKIVNDQDLIEKEYVEKAKKIVNANRDDPYKQSQALTEFRSEYMQKEYNKSIKTDKQ